MNKIAKLVLVAEIIIYYILLVLGLYAVAHKYGPEKNGEVLGYGIVSIVAIIVLTMIVLVATSIVRFSAWSATAFIGLVLIAAAPSVEGFYLLENSSSKGSALDKDDTMSAITALLSIGLIFYSLAVLGGSLFKTELRNGLAVFLATAWVATILSHFWNANFIEETKQVPVLTLALFGTVALTLSKPATPPLGSASETQPLVGKAGAV